MESSFAHVLELLAEIEDPRRAEGKAVMAAAAAFERALERNPDFIVARRELAASYAHLGRIEDAEWEAKRSWRWSRVSACRASAGG